MRAICLMQYLVALNIAATAAFGADKGLAKKGMLRIPEKVLFALAIAGGAPGAYIGMKAFRHKTRKPRFSIGIPMIGIFQITALMLYLKY